MVGTFCDGTSKELRFNIAGAAFGYYSNHITDGMSPSPAAVFFEERSQRHATGRTDNTNKCRSPNRNGNIYGRAKPVFPRTAL